jgi:phosphoglycolate phosphatase-like HAD superfamily hydrolase
MHQNVILFDIDGTLIRAAGAGARAFRRATGELLGSESAADGFSYAGLTDRRIARRAIAAAGAQWSEELVEQLISRYLAALEEELFSSRGSGDAPEPAPEQTFHVLPGAEPLLEVLATAPHVVSGLGTGNVRAGAELKLRRGGLHAWFRFGGFGCDHEDRAELLRAGAARGAALLGRALEACRVIVVGDTELDMEAARAIGAVAVGVGTGGRTPEILFGAGAHHVFRDLAAPGVADVLMA